MERHNGTMNASHGGHSGDIVYGLALARRIAMANSCTVDLYIARDRPAQLAPGMQHPNGRTHMMSEAAFEFIRPLVTSQPYIGCVSFVRDAEVPADAVRLDPYRFIGGLNLAAGNIVDFPGKIYGIPIDASAAWLDAGNAVSASWPLTVAFSPRYRNAAIDYSFLAKLEGVRFVGLPDEYEDFKSRYGLHDLCYERCRTALELAQAIRCSRVFMGNQSMAFAIAEGLKVNRALEVCELAPNVIPSGPGGGSYVYQTALVRLLRTWGLDVDQRASKSMQPRFALYLPPHAPAAADPPPASPAPVQPESLPLQPRPSSARRDAARAPEPSRIRLVCATRASRDDFFSTTALGRSLTLHRPSDLDVRLFPRNTQGLPEVYNTAIAESSGGGVILLFVHDDVHLCDFHWADRLREGLEAFDILGLVGNRRRVPGQPGWLFLDEKLTRDSRSNLSGTVAHGRSSPPDSIDEFGPSRVAVKLLDGLFVAVRSETLRAKSLRFDERFEFHFYDLDFCRQAEQAGAEMGTWPISVIHESAGNFISDGWRTGYEKYIEKWGE